MIDSSALTFLPRARFLRERPIMLIQDCPLDIEIKQKSAFSSQSSALQFAELGKAGISRGYIHPSYLLSFRPEKGNIGAAFHHKSLALEGYRHWPPSKKDFILDYFYTELEQLKAEIRAVRPGLIICAGKWALHFLTNETGFTETNKSQYGTLLKWRASHLQLHSWWEADWSHIVVPILPAASVWQLPEREAVIKQDYNRLGILAEAAIDGEIEPFIARQENYVVAPTFDEAVAYLTQILELLETERKITADVETRDGYMDCIGLAIDSVNAICIPFSTTTECHYWTESQEVAIVGLLWQIMRHPNCRLRGQNFLYDMQYILRDLGMPIVCHQDSMIMHHIMFPGMEKSLDFLSSLYCNVYKYWKDDGKTHKGATDRERWIYNCRDTTNTHEICDVLEDVHSTLPEHIQAAYAFQQNEVQPALFDLMVRGVAVHEAEKRQLYDELQVIIAEIQSILDYALEEPLNVNSTPQMRALFYDLFQCPVQKNRDTGQPTLADEAMNVLLEVADPLLRPFIHLVLEFRSMKVFSSTFLAMRTDVDGRMRCSYNPCGTDTFRLSSTKNAFGSGGNLQNVPMGGETILGRRLPNVRALFIPDPEFIFFDIDLDSADLRIVVEESGAEDLRQMFREGKKPYIEMMKEYYHDQSKNKHSAEYRIFKSFAHGTNYLGTSSGLAGRLGLLVHEVDKLQKWYFGRNPEIARWHAELKNQVTKRGWIENIFGYRRYFLNKREPTLFQIAAAWKPQSTVGILINKGMVALRHNEPDVQVLLQVHDSLAGQFPIAKPELENAIITRCSIPLPYPTPLVIPVGINTSTENWGKCK